MKDRGRTWETEVEHGELHLNLEVSDFTKKKEQNLREKNTNFNRINQTVISITEKSASKIKSIPPQYHPHHHHNQP